MIVRTLDEVCGSDSDVSGPTWRSRRLLLAHDGMGFSMHDTILSAGTETEMCYLHHLEAVYCIGGEGEIQLLPDGPTWPISAGTLYALDQNDSHVLRANTELRMVCAFNPPVTGQEVHGPDGAYPPPAEGPNRSEGSPAKSIDLYPSRVGGEAEILERKDPVVHAREDVRRRGPLSEVALNDYERRGFMSFDSFLTTKKFVPLVREAERLANVHRSDPSPRVILEPDDDEVRSIFQVHQDKGVFAAFVQSPLVQELVDQVLGAPWYLHQSRINFKPAFRGRAFDWHSDFETWHVEDGMPRMRAFSLSINLTANRIDNGPLMLIPESHRSFISCPGRTPEANYERSLKRQEAGVPPESIIEALAKKHGIESPTGAAGSATLFDCNLLHGSNGNITPFPRTNLFLVFNQLDNVLGEPFSGQLARPEYIAQRNPKASS